MNINTNVISTAVALLLTTTAPLAVAADDTTGRRPLPRFDRVVIDDQFPGGYQVEVADVNGDGKPDLVALGGGTCAWYENPSWRKRIITDPDTTPGIISSASADLDGDGRAEVAIGYDFAMREPTRGKLGLALQGDSPDDPWTFRPIADVPSIHRLRWGDLDADDRLDLVVAPIFGQTATPPNFQDGFARLEVYRSFSVDPDRPAPEHVASRPVMHAIEVTASPTDGRDIILSADNLGVALYRRHDPGQAAGQPYRIRPLIDGFSGEPPARGASEVHLGRLADGRVLLVTIEPWHGHLVAAYTAEITDHPTLGPVLGEFGPRMVLDDTLDQGHALWLADVDGDGDDEVFAGHRGEDHRVSAYDFDGTTWHRTVLDTTIASQDLRGADLNADGLPDVVSIGGSTHNLILYRPLPADSNEP